MSSYRSDRMLVKGLLIALAIMIGVVVFVPLYVFLRVYFQDVKQKQHSILRNFPLLGRIRYIFEKSGPEFRQYLFNNDEEGKPFNRNQFEYVYKTAKYNKRMIGYGSEREFDAAGLYLVNHMFPKQHEELRIEQFPKIDTMLYKIDNEKLLSRKEHREQGMLDPYLLPDDDAILLGKDTVRDPFKVKGIIGQSAMSFGSLGDHAITALSKGLGLAGGTWMNTGEGSISPYHLKGDVDIIMQVSSALFGVRNLEGGFSWETFNSPSRFREFDDAKGLLEFVDQMRDVGGKPVGVKLVIGEEAQIESFVHVMKETSIVPDFITIDGGEGGSGATYYELAESVGLPAFAALPLLDDMLKKYGLRERTYIIASGKLLTPDKIAMALALGADMINIARGFMLSIGCIMAKVCHTNKCPVGVATTDPELQKGLSIEEKKFRVCNYLVSLRQGVFEMASVAGIDSPRKFTRDHIVYKDEFNKVTKVGDYS